MALLNGRDLFVRRPNCRSLWVAPASAILSKTREEVDSGIDSKGESFPTRDAPETYLVFVKQSQRRAMAYVEHVGSVEAVSSPEALEKAIVTYDSGDVFVWWVCPERSITRSDEDDIESMFEPAKEKRYRHPNQYRTVEAMRHVERSAQKAPDDDENQTT